MSHDDSHEAAVEVLFSPPLYLQRYNLAISHLTKHNVKSVADFGCAECNFFKLLPTVSNLQEILLVDVDRDLLLKRKHVIEPELRHFVFRRKHLLEVQLLSGSVSDFDVRTAGCEAVTLIEIIEHLHKDNLNKLRENVFGNIHPRLCIVTTPNSEFNPLFQNEKFLTFRHWDHKFEWTRQEFQAWCDQICKDYAYEVEYAGVGFLASKPHTFHLGPCSQAAIFVARDGAWDMGSSQVSPHCDSGTLEGLDSRPYQVIAESCFPYETSQPTVEETIDIEIAYFLQELAVMRLQGLEMATEDDRTVVISSEEQDDDEFSVSINRITSLRKLKGICTLNQIRERLVAMGYNLSNNQHTITVSVSKLLGSETDEDEEEDDKEDMPMANHPPFHLKNTLRENTSMAEGKGDHPRCPDGDTAGSFACCFEWKYESDWDLPILVAEGNC